MSSISMSWDGQSSCSTPLRRLRICSKAASVSTPIVPISLSWRCKLLYALFLYGCMTSHDRVGHQWNFGFMPYGKQWRALRRLFSSKYGTTQGLRMFYDSHRVTMSKLLLSTLRDPDAFTEHLRL